MIFILELNKEYTYKEICKILGWKVTDGNSKKAQIRNLESSYEFYHPINKNTKKPKKSYVFTKKLKDIELEDGRKNNGRPSEYYDSFFETIFYYLHYNNGIIEKKTNQMFSMMGLKKWFDEDVEDVPWDTEINYDYLDTAMYQRRKYIVDSSLEKMKKASYIEWEHCLYIKNEKATEEENMLYEECIEREIALLNIDIHTPKNITIGVLHGEYKHRVPQFYEDVKARFVEESGRNDITIEDVYKKYKVKWFDMDYLMNRYSKAELEMSYKENIEALNYSLQNSLLNTLVNHKEKNKLSDKWLKNNIIRMEVLCDIEDYIKERLEFII